MNNTVLLIDAAGRAQERLLQALDGLSPEQINRIPAPEVAPSIKSLAWLVWHVAREMDFQIADLLGVEPLYFSEGWGDKFALDLPPDTQDWKHTPSEAAKVMVTDIQLLRDYLSRATDFVIDYLAHVSAKSLGDIIDESWDPPVTRAARLVSIVDDAIMHSGQAIYVKRLIRT